MEETIDNITDIAIDNATRIVQEDMFLHDCMYVEFDMLKRNLVERMITQN